jgi:hypothetical protein
MTDDEQQKLTVMMVELSSKVQILLDKQDELADNINKIKEAVYNPDSGLYARLRELDVRIQTIESWKATNVRIMWMVATALVGLWIHAGWAAIF